MRSRSPTDVRPLCNTTQRDYQRYITRWKANGQPDPEGWLTTLTPNSARVARAALRRELGPDVDLPWRPQTKKTPVALSTRELERCRIEAYTMDRRAGLVLDLLYATGARLTEACGVRPEDCGEDYVVLRETKRRPGGQRVERIIPLGDRGRSAVQGLTASANGRLVPVGSYQVEAWMRKVGERAGVRLHPHKLRATFATHMLAAGADVRTVQELMGHTHLETTMRYLAVTDEAKVRAVRLLG